MSGVPDLHLFLLQAFTSATEAEKSAALHQAVDHRHNDFVSLLLAWGADVDGRDAEGRQPLQTAIDIGALEVARTLLSWDAAVDGLEGGENPLQSAAGNGDIEAVELLLSYGARVIEGRRSLLILATRFGGGDVLVIKRLLEAGAAADLQDEGRTALHWAAQLGQAGAVRELLAAWPQGFAVYSLRQIKMGQLLTPLGGSILHLHRHFTLYFINWRSRGANKGQLLRP